MTISKLSANASLKEVIDKFEEISLTKLGGVLDIVVKTVLPTTYKEGRLCIITAKECPKIIIDFKEPEIDSLNDGEIYIQTCEGEGEIELVADSEGQKISVNTDKIVQKDEGELIRLNDVYICKGSNWIKGFSNFYLFKDGVYNSVVGDFQKTASVGDVSFKIEKELPNFINNIFLATSSYSYSISIATPRKLDFSKYSKLVLVETTHKPVEDTYKSKFGVAEQNNLGYFVASKEVPGCTTTTTSGEVIRHELDISGISGGEYFVKVALGYNNVTKLKSQIYIKEIYFER